MNKILTQTEIWSLCTSLSDAIGSEADSEHKQRLQDLFDKIFTFFGPTEERETGLVLLASLPKPQEEEDEDEIPRDRNGFPIHYNDGATLSEIGYCAGVLAGRHQKEEMNHTRSDFAKESWEQFARDHTFSEDLAAAAPAQYQASFLKGYQQIVGEPTR
jgi:hypothetical protein